MMAMSRTAGRRSRVAPPITVHTCGWARQPDGSFRCIQDYYAVGWKPETACGRTWTPPAVEPTD